SEEQIWDSYNQLLLSHDVDRVRKLLVRYELFKKSLDVPGDIIECGVFKGVGFMYWLKLLTIFAPASRKKVIGFDTFSSFADSLLPYEKVSAKAYTDEATFEGVDPKDILACAKRAGFADRAELVAGDIMQTAPSYVKENPGFRISLLHLDFDTYHGSKVVLENFYRMVTPGGIIVLDEYALRGWGESDAVDEFFADKPVKIRSVDHSNTPTAYVIKP
ncbi:MAG: class I SAM-dependent methyltransferase, partial [Magnetococcales bacterium]|nr:class I SAM-dependent methyltransferase [Magnetococcales bacterium]